MKKITAYEHTIDRDGWPIILTHIAYLDEDGNVWEHTIDRDGWPLERLREDWKIEA